MTARTDAQGRHERREAVVLELDLDKCDNTFGVNDGATSFCTAGIKDTGTLQVGGTTVVRLAATASAVDDTYNGMTLRSTGGTGSGQEARITDYAGATRDATVAPVFSPALDGTTTYDVIDRPTACFNSFFTCQDRINYVKGVQTVMFSGRGIDPPAGELVRPYLVGDVKSAATEIDFKAGLSRSFKMTATLVDEPDADRDQDPYVDDRPVPAGGTYIARLLARNPNYATRPARLLRGFVVKPWDWATFQSERYVIESITGPKAGRTYNVVLKDPIKLADRIKIPPASDGTLAADITAGQLSFDITGDPAQYDLYGFPTWVQIRDETIKILSRSGATFTVETGGRGAFNSVDVAHKLDDKLQLCRVFESVPLTDVIISLWNDSGVPSSFIDTVELASEDATWLGPKYAITRAIVKPTEASKMIAELCVLANAGQWWDPVTQKFQFKVNMPDLVGVAPPAFTDVASVMLDTLDIDARDADRLTRIEILFGLVTPVANLGEANNYQFGKIKIDADAEGANSFGDERAQQIKTPWLGAANGSAASSLVSRILAYRRDVQLRWKFSLDPKDHQIVMGQLIDVTAAKHTDVNGQAKKSRLRITRLVDRGSYVEVGAMSTAFGGRNAFIAPTGHPDYDVATEAQRQFAFISNASGLLPDGSPAYQII